MTGGDDIRRRGARLGIVLVAAALGLAMLAARAGAAQPDGSAQSLGTRYAQTGFSSVEARADGGVVAQQGSTLRSYLPDGAPDPAAPPRGLGEGQTFAGLGGKSFRIEGGKVTRLDPNGSVDASFGTNGTVESGNAKGVVELPSGKVALITFVGMGAREFSIYAGVTVLNADGSADRANALAGSVGDYPGPIEEFIATPGGGSLVVGREFMLELGPDGSLDTGFGTNGLVFAAVSNFAGAHLLADGTIEIAGSSYVRSEGKDEPALFRYDAAGRADASFGDQGTRLFHLGGFEGGFAVSWGTDGSLVLGGRGLVQAGCEGHSCEEVPALAAFDAAGNLQTSFGEGGVLRLTALAAPPGGFASPGVEALARRPDGSLVAVGSAPPNRSVAFLAALSPQGSLLPTFGEGGIVEVREPTPATESVAGLAPIEGGGVLAAADTDVGTGTHPALVRYAADGTLDTTFGDGTGFVSLPGGGEATRIAVDGEETLVGVEGKRRDRLFMLRTGDGSPVSSFGAGGVLNLAHGIGVQAVATAPDGEPIVLTKGGLDAPPVVERLGADGRPDRSFGRGGKVTLRLPGGGEPSGGALVVTPAGRILVGAISGKRVALARLLPDGRLDRRFGARGWSVTGLGEGVGSMMLAPAGARLYVAATYGHGDRQRLGLLRLGAAGGRDRGFGHRGLRTVGGVSYTRVTAVEPTPAGVVVAVEKGVRPLFTFAKGGGVRQRPAEPDGRRAGDVHATLSAGRLFVGWSPYLGQYGQDPSYHVAVRAAGR